MSTAVASSALLADMQTRPDAPFGSLFLSVTFTQEADFPVDGKNSTSSNEETSNDGTSRLDPVYDDDHHQDVDEHDLLCYLTGAGTLAGVL
ncbi:MAG TPA: hypothetical protein VN729_12875 [Ktedonobacteraceae bacterium]|nr:hypothetical protein [Ktedonobacteraceae bacterium]